MKNVAWCVAMLVCRMGLAAAVDTDPVFKGGLWQTVVYETPSAEPVYFSGESRCEAAQARDYCLFLDIWYDNGTTSWSIQAPFRQGTHGWEKAAGAFVPVRPVKKIQMHAFLRHGKGRAEFRRLDLSRRPPVPPAVRPAPPAAGKTVVWTADSMRRVSPNTFPSAAEATCPLTAHVTLARRERESFQVLVSAGADAGWTAGGVELPVLRNASGAPLRGTLDWRRVGYVPRVSGCYLHPHGEPLDEAWLPDPLLPPAPFRVRAGMTQALWLTVHAAADAEPGDYSGEIVLTERGEARARIRVTARVEALTLPAVFGMKTSFSVMDGFTRAQYPDRFLERKRETWDLMLDHRLNPDDISRTTPPDIDDLLYARARGMNAFNILNIVPAPTNAFQKWVCFSPPEATEDPAFQAAFKARLKPYVARLAEHGLDRLAYLYGFDERERRYYPGVDALWKNLKADFPSIPMMTTAMMYRDYVMGGETSPLLFTTDWHCPLTSVYDTTASDAFRARGKQVWWYVACGPIYPYANFASLEYPPVEARLLGWMTHLYRADGLLYWHVNFWNGPCFDERDTFLTKWNARSGLWVPGDGVLLYPGRNQVVPSIRLAQVRDGVEDYEWLQLAAERAGTAAADEVSRGLIRTLMDFTRDPAAIRAARNRLAQLAAPAPAGE